MPTARSQQPRCSFGGIEICYERITVHNPGRHHVHQYPHSPGGAAEKLGTDLAHTTVEANFQTTFAKWPDLYPNALLRLFAFARSQVTQTLVHPSLGSFPAFIINWTQTLEARVLSGEKVSIEFLEDQEAQFLTDQIAQPSAASLDSAWSGLSQSLLAATVDQLLSFSAKDQNLFDAIRTSVNSILAIRDQVDLYGNNLAAKIDGLTSLCAQLDAATSMQDPRAWPVVDSLHALWAQAIQLQTDLQSRAVKLTTWTVPATMAATDIALALYGDTARQSDILSLNGGAIDNPMKVRAGTTIRYYPDAPAQP